MATRINAREINTSLSEAIRDQRCQHALTGRAPEHKVCANNFECGNCPFDQMLEDTSHVERPVDRPAHAVLAA
jgi:hypothetical protein